MNKLSIIICTYNHQDRFSGIKKTVTSLSSKNNVDFIHEIIVVDNGNSISNIERKQLSTLSSKIIFIIENKIGLSVARNTGAKKAIGDVIAFVDDDVWVSDNWAKNILEIYKDNNVLCAGGKIEMLNMNILKNKHWVSNYFLRFLFPTEFPSKAGPILEPYFLIGANMSFRKTVFEKYGLFEERLGRVSNKLLSCEDTEFISRLPKESVFYVENAKIQGEIEEKRLTRRYMLRRLFWQGYSDYIFVQKVGTSNFFDKNEVFFGWSFIKFIFSKLIHLKLFEFVCSIARISGFYISKVKLRGR
jgi:glycosyltransferase involved in cell wall biosynthesis